MSHPKSPELDAPIHEPLAQRWSPRAFSWEPLDRDDVASLFEAARWAPSSGNLQPWEFVIADRDQPVRHQAMVSLLDESNAKWASLAPLVGLAAARNHRADGTLNRHAGHDVGLALGNLLVQATTMGLSVHLLGGFDVKRARRVLDIPRWYEPLTMFVVGRKGDPATLSVYNRAREESPRPRRRVCDFVHRGVWTAPSGLSACVGT